LTGPFHVVRSRYLEYNSGALVSEGEACLIDPGILPDEIAELAKVVGGLTIRAIVLTHADWDHVLGPEHLPRSPIVAHAAYEADLDPVGIRAVLARLESTAGVTRDRQFEPPLPDMTFNHEMTIELGSLELRLTSAPGHAASMLTIYEPQSASLWAADILSDTEIPSVIHDLAAYEQTVADVAGLEVRTLVPGHGTPADEGAEILRRLREDQAYLAELRGQTEEAVRKGLSLEETVAASAKSPLRRGADDDTTHRFNVEKVYADLGGDADPMAVGFAGAWLEATRG
jgi:hydroxyacylglutathione hydrolase